MRLPKSPARPEWKPLYALEGLAQTHGLKAWEAFLGKDAGRIRA